MTTATVPTAELETIRAAYHADLAAAVKQGKTLRDLETREGWTAYRAILAEQARRRAEMRRNSHRYN